jgi:glycosyltransferase involved in cell wall biosynthesis
MRVLNINKYYQHTGGGDRFFFDTEKVLAEHGHEVIPFCLNYPGNLPSDYAKYFPEGVSGRAVDAQPVWEKARLFINGVYSWPSRRALAALLRQVRPEVAHVHVIHFTMSPSIFGALREHGIPTVFSLHDYRIVCVGGYLYAQGAVCERCKTGNPLPAVWHRCYRNSRAGSLMGALGHSVSRVLKIYEAVDLFTVPHVDMLERMVEWGIPREKLRVLKNPFFSVEHCGPEEAGESVAFFGALTQAKGAMTLVQAAALLPDVPFEIYGRGPALTKMLQFAQERGLRNIRIDTETRWGCGLKERLCRSRIVVSPSEWHTPMEYSTLEAMSLGKPIVASRIGGNQMVIEEGQTGLLFHPGDAVDLSQTIKVLYEDPVRCRQMGERGAAYVRSEFSSDGYYHQLRAIYEEAIRHRREASKKTVASAFS